MASLMGIFALAAPAVAMEGADAVSGPTAPAADASSDAVTAPSPSTSESSPAAAPVTASKPDASEMPDDFSDFADLSLADLLDTPVSVASLRAQREREAPAVLTVLRREEILDSGARDLIDLLRLVPGFQFGVDVQGAVAPGVRGLWGQEGKVLVLIDGIPMNEHSYSTVQYGFHFPLELIERIEIIRGPGSVLYGGYAELAVVQIITRRGADLGGSVVAARFGAFDDVSSGFVQGAAATGRVLESWGGLEYSVGVAAGFAHPSDAEYADFYGQRAVAAADHRLDRLQVNAGAAWKGWRLRLLGDDFRRDQRDAFGYIEPAPVSIGFRTGAAHLEGDIRPIERLTITPIFAYQWQRPWYTPEQRGLADPAQIFNHRMQRIRGGLRIAGDPTDWLRLMAGGEYFEDHARARGDVYWTGRSSVSLYDGAGYAEAAVDTRWVDVVAGARFERHNQAGDSFVPRAALTARAGDGHLKILGSQAFRAPSIQNFNLNPTIRPELTTVYEAELGWQWFERVLTTVNVFQTDIERPILYFYDEASGAEAYVNDDAIGTRGLEFAAQGRFERGWLRLGYAFYQADVSDASIYAVPGEESVTLAFAPHQIVAAGGYDVWRSLRVNGSLTIWSGRWGYIPTDSSGTGRLSESDAAAIFDLTAVWRKVAGTTLDLSLSALNLLDDDYAWMQAYDGGHGPLPGRGRQFTLGAQYAF